MNFSQFKRKECRASNRPPIEIVGNHDDFLSRIEKTLYYGKLPKTDCLSLPVTELAAELYSEVKKENENLQRLRVEDAAQFSRKACVHPSSLVLALVYLERLKSCNPAFVDKSVPFELFVVSMMVACKYLNDEEEYNYDWAVFAAMETKKMNNLEKEFLNAMDWNLFVSDDLFWERLEDLETTLAMKEGYKRGYYSYTELLFLLELTDYLLAVRSFLTVSALCLTSYVAFILTLMGLPLGGSQLTSVVNHLTNSSSGSNCGNVSLILTSEQLNTIPDYEIDAESNEFNAGAKLNAFQSKLNCNADVEKWIKHNKLSKMHNAEVCFNSSSHVSWKLSNVNAMKLGIKYGHLAPIAHRIVHSSWSANILSPFRLATSVEFVTH